MLNRLSKRGPFRCVRVARTRVRCEYRNTTFLFRIETDKQYGVNCENRGRKGVRHTI